MNQFANSARVTATVPLHAAANTSHLLYAAVNDSGAMPQSIQTELQHMKQQIDRVLNQRPSMPPLLVERMEIMQELYETLVAIPEQELADAAVVEQEKNNVNVWIYKNQISQTFARELQNYLPKSGTQAQDLLNLGYEEYKEADAPLSVTVKNNTFRLASHVKRVFKSVRH